MAFLLVLALGVLAYQAARTVLALRAATAETTTLRDHVSDGDWPAAERSADRLAEQAEVARRSTDGWLWSGLTVVPWVGDDADAVRRSAAALDVLASRGVRPALDAARQVERRPLRGADGRFDLGATTGLVAPLGRSADAAQDADARLADVDPAGLVGPLRPRVAELQTRLDQLDTGLRAASELAGLLPDLLGGDGARRYLLVVQNNAESRATGGLPGSVSVLQADRGRLRLTGQGSAPDFGAPGGPPAARLGATEERLFGAAAATDFRDTNSIPDFPRAASLMAAMAEQQRGTRVDGVVTVDPVVLSEVLAATGPVEADGVTLSGENVVRELLFDPYQELPGDQEQNAYFERTSAAILDVLLGGDLDQRGVLTGLAGGVAERRVLVWSDRPEEQAGLERAGVAGRLPRDRGAEPEVGFYLNSATRAKIQYFLRYDGRVRSVGCDDRGRQVVQVRMRLRSEVPEPVSQLAPYVRGLGDEAPPGVNLLNAALVAPAGGRLEALAVGGRSTEVATGELDGRPVAVFPVRLDPGESVEVVADLVTRRGQDGAPRLEWTPGVSDAPTSTTARSRCG